PPAIATRGAALRSECFAEEGDTTLPAVTGAREDFDFIDEHDEREGGREGWRVGVLECWSVASGSITPLLHHSITPLLHHSITPPLHFPRRCQSCHRPYR